MQQRFCSLVKKTGEWGNEEPESSFPWETFLIKMAM